MPKDRRRWRRRSPSGGVVTELFITAAAHARHAALAERAASQGALVQAVSGEVMAELAQTITPQGVLAVCRFVDVPLARLAAGVPRLALILANVRDPGNAGTVLRTADAAGADGVIFSDASVDPYNSKCVRATAGSIFHLPLVVDAPVAAAVAAMRDAGLRVLAADGRAGRSLDEAGPACSGSRPHGCSGTRRGDCPPTCWRWPTRRSRCPSTGRRKASIWRPPRRSACTPPPVLSGDYEHEGAAPSPPQRARV